MALGLRKKLCIHRENLSCHWGEKLCSLYPAQDRHMHNWHQPKPFGLHTNILFVEDFHPERYEGHWLPNIF